MSAKSKQQSNVYRPHDRITVEFKKPSRTKQEFKDDCDANNIIARFNKTGVLTHTRNAQPQYLDLANLPDLQTSLHIMQEAQEAFMKLPATVRKTFDNDPIQFAEYAAKPENLAQMREWNLAPPLPDEPKPTKVEIINPAPPAGEQ